MFEPIEALKVRDLDQNSTDLIKNREMIPICFRQPVSTFRFMNRRLAFKIHDTTNRLTNLVQDCQEFIWLASELKRWVGVVNRFTVLEPLVAELQLHSHKFLFPRNVFEL